MPLRHDLATWYNGPHCQAAYQPAGAPNSLIAHYNMARGGDNRYRATAGTEPTWSASRGWTFVNASAQWLTTSIVPTANHSMMIRIANAQAVAYRILASARDSSTAVYEIFIHNGASTMGRYGSQPATSGQFITTGVLTLTRDGFWVNQTLYPFSSAPTWNAVTAAIDIGRRSIANVYHYQGDVLAAAVWSSPLTRSEVVAYTTQMLYCDNPDWSVWGRRRKYYVIPFIDTGIALAPHAGLTGIDFAHGPYGAESGPRRSFAPASGHQSDPVKPFAPLSGHRGKLND